MLLNVKNLSTWFAINNTFIRAVDNISFDLEEGKTLGIIGESGCGKSITAHSIIRLLPTNTVHKNESKILFNGIDLLSLPEYKMRKIRGKEISMIFQDPMTSLNPVLTIGEQLFESLRQEGNFSHKCLKSRAIELLDKVKIPQPEQRLYHYPHQLSGGMRQRVMIAIAMSLKPKLLIADEPTTALDVTTQAKIISLLKELQQQFGTAIIFITHDLGLAYQMADEIALMYAGSFFEKCSKKEFFENPGNPYAKQLLQTIPSFEKRKYGISAIKGMVPKLDKEFSKCKFLSRCDYKKEICEKISPEYQEIKPEHFSRCHFKKPILNQQPNSIKFDLDKSLENEQKNIESKSVLSVTNLKVYFPMKKGFFSFKKDYIKAVDDVSFNVYKGETLALVGESGSGKSTLAFAILSLVQHNVGDIVVFGNKLNELKQTELRKLRKDIQIIFQDPYSSLDPRMNIQDILLEGIQAQAKNITKVEQIKLVDNLLKEVGLQSDSKERFPHEFSGGQRQRISIARSLILNPGILVLDEPTSALDLSIQAQILNLLKKLQKKHNLSYLFITHDMSVVEYMAHKVAVMHEGKIVEYGNTEDIIKSPKHSYTKLLLNSVAKIE